MGDTPVLRGAEYERQVLSALNRALESWREAYAELGLEVTGTAYGMNGRTAVPEVSVHFRHRRVAGERVLTLALAEDDAKDLSYPHGDLVGPSDAADDLALALYEVDKYPLDDLPRVEPSTG